MKSKIQSGLSAILLLLVVSCSKDNSSTSSNSTSLGSGTSRNSTANRSGSVSNSQTSSISAATMDDAQADGLNIVGQWILYYDWNCDGDPGATVMTFNADGTWSSDEGYTGIWVKGRHMLMFTFDSDIDGYRTTYSGDIFSQEIKGIQTTFQYAGSLQGCFNMATYSGGPLDKNKDGSLDANGKSK